MPYRKSRLDGVAFLGSAELKPRTDPDTRHRVDFDFVCVPLMDGRTLSGRTWGEDRARHERAQHKYCQPPHAVGLHF